MLFYVYLSIHRPMEIWKSLGDLRPELIFFTLMTRDPTLTERSLTID